MHFEASTARDIGCNLLTELVFTVQ